MKGLTAMAVGIGFIAFAPAVQAHGVRVTYSSAETIQVQATFASGEPLGNAQVTVFSPANPQIPWSSGTTDPAGNFAFVPDPALPGKWEIQVRLAGHGDILHIPIEANDAADTPSRTGAALAIAPSSQPISTQQLPLGQKLAMGGLFAWGCLGTALYFKRESPT